MNIKQVHEKIRSHVDAIDEEKYELRGKTKNFQIIQRYTRRGEDEIEEINISSKDENISLLINQKGKSTVTFVKDGKIEGKILDEEGVQKIVDEIIKLLS